MARGDVETREDMERQVAALPLRLGVDGSLEVLLVTSRETRRWVLPKGNLMKGRSRPEVAALEAEEEAGVEGRIVPRPYAHFDYWKRRTRVFKLCRVDVFLLVVTREAGQWKEDGERQRVWVSVRSARDMVLEPGLQTILKTLSQDDSVLDLLRPKRQRSGQRKWGDVARSLAAIA